MQSILMLNKTSKKHKETTNTK